MNHHRASVHTGCFPVGQVLLSIGIKSRDL
jgi:hypothetical protein